MILRGNEDKSKQEESLNEIRTLVLLEGLPPEIKEEEDNFVSRCSLRAKIWKLLLHVKNLDANKYASLVEAKSSKDYQKIRNDTFRTFKHGKIFFYLFFFLKTEKQFKNLDEGFRSRVPEEKLIRVLNAFINSCSLSQITYVQGMNVVCAPFLYVMPELDAFYAFSNFIKIYCPLYFYAGIDGAYAGIQILDEILQVVDSELYAFLDSKKIKPSVFAMPPILSFSASTPPLEELLKLWDFLLAFGVHMNIVCVAAQIVLIRDQLMNSDRPNNLLRTLPPLDTNSILTVAISLVRQLPDELYKELVTHPWRPKKKSKFKTLPRNFKA